MAMRSVVSLALDDRPASVLQFIKQAILADLEELSPLPSHPFKGGVVLLLRLLDVVTDRLQVPLVTSHEAGETRWSIKVTAILAATSTVEP
jgi:hypothetical protein